MHAVPAQHPFARFVEDHIRILAVLISFALSAWAQYSDGIVNRDGILYLEAAAQLEQGQWSAALAVYTWPFYSALIALMSYLTGLGVEPAAHLLDALLFALMVWAFINVVAELGGDRKTLVAAALVVLLAPQLNEHRSDIFRDNGYWAFYLLSLWLFIKYFRFPCLRYALAWGVSIIIAMLFRIEGMVFMLLLPFVLLLRRDMDVSKRVLALANTYLVGLAGLVLLVVWWVMDPGGVLHNTGRLGEPLNWLSYLWQGFGGHLHEQAARLNQAILNQFSESYALHAVIATLVTLLAFGIFGALSPVYVLLVLHSFVSGTFRASLSAEMRDILYWLILINVVILSLFLVKYFFLTGRYPMPLALTLMLVLPFHLIHLKKRWDRKVFNPRVRKLYLGLIAVTLIAVAVDGLVSFGAKKDYLKDAGDWLAQETPVGARIYTNNEIVAYYASQGHETFIHRESRKIHELFGTEWRNFDYLAVRIDRHDKTFEAVARQAGAHEPLKVFKNKRGGKVLVFQLSRK